MNHLLTIALSLFLASGVAFATTDEVDCTQAMTTLETEECSRQEVAVVEAELDQYLATARQRYDGEEAVLAAFDQAQQSWLAYRRDHCQATYALWVGGSIRGVMMNHCLLQQTRQRTWDIWHTYLTYMDSTPPLLPEPPR